MDAKLSGKVILVTGASGGIGSATARTFAAEGARLILHAHANTAKVQALAKEIKTECLVVKADLTREADVKKLFTQSLKKFKRIDVLVANAGAWEKSDVPLAGMSAKQWRSTLDGVLTSTFLCLREFFKIVARQKTGNAVLIGSTAGIFGEAGHADYASGKAALAFGLTRTAKNEIARLAPHTANYCGGRVNCVCPGWTVVPRNAAKLQDENIVRKVTATMALPQIGRPDDIANAVVFLASDHLARHITGQTLTVAGGMEGRLLWQPGEMDPKIV